MIDIYLYHKHIYQIYIHTYTLIHIHTVEYYYTQLPRPKSWGAVFYLFFTYHPIYHQIPWALPSIYSFSKCFSTAATVTVLAQDKLFWAVSHRGSTSGTLLLSSCPFPSTPALVSTAPSSWNDAPNSSVGSKPPASSHLTSTMVFKLLSGCWLRL